MIAAPATPPEWFIVFRTWAGWRWADWLAMGRYRHVACFGPVPAVAGWLFYDFGVNAASVAVVPDGPRADQAIGRMVDDALVVRFVPPLAVREPRLKPLFACTSAVAHLTGVKSCALRPDAFLRDCLAQGAEIVVEP